MRSREENVGLASHILLEDGGPRAGSNLVAIVAQRSGSMFCETRSRSVDGSVPKRNPWGIVFHRCGPVCLGQAQQMNPREPTFHQRFFVVYDSLCKPPPFASDGAATSSVGQPAASAETAEKDAEGQEEKTANEKKGV